MLDTFRKAVRKFYLRDFIRANPSQTIGIFRVYVMSMLHASIFKNEATTSIRLHTRAVSIFDLMLSEYVFCLSFTKLFYFVYFVPSSVSKNHGNDGASEQVVRVPACNPRSMYP